MSEPNKEDLTQFLLDLGEGKTDAASSLVPYVYDELKAIAQAYARPGESLQPTALVHEAYLKLFDQSRLQINDRHHFYALAARSMRQLLVNQARKRKSAKRGGDWQRLSLDHVAAQLPGREVDMLDLDEVLAQLAELDPRQSEVVELRFFGGLEMKEIAAALGLSLASVEREWYAARAWLGSQLRRQDTP